jgi:fumarylacetoacetase
LRGAADQAAGALNIAMELQLRSEEMARQGMAPVTLSRGNVADLYWTFAQMVAHHSSNGSALDAGDLLGSGTVSGPLSGSWGSLLELTRGGTEPIRLPNGETRRFLTDGDEVILNGYCERPGYARIGFGQCAARILPAKEARR